MNAPEIIADLKLFLTTFEEGYHPPDCAEQLARLSVALMSVSGSPRGAFVSLADRVAELTPSPGQLPPPPLLGPVRSPSDI